MRFLRYPGGKSKLLSFLVNYLPTSESIEERYIEPFVGGGSVFLHINPKNAIISDLNKELIDLYKGIRNYPHKVWEFFESFPSGKLGYYKIRDEGTRGKPLYYRAARTLFLNRTCFKGMWRHNPDGAFNVGYGGEDRRWVITHKSILELSKRFKNALICKADFERIFDKVMDGDFIFLDPPYKPGHKEMKTAHYINGKFTYNDQIRLAKCLRQITKKKDIHWIMTNSANEEITKLYDGFSMITVPKGTSERVGIYTENSNEVLITNYC